MCVKVTARQSSDIFSERHCAISKNKFHFSLTEQMQQSTS